MSKLSEGVFNDPENYERCSAPHESEEAAQSAAESFMAAVGELRKEYRVAEVVVMTQTNTAERGLIHCRSFGDSSNSARLVATAYRAIVAPLLSELLPGDDL